MAILILALTQINKCKALLKPCLLAIIFFVPGNAGKAKQIQVVPIKEYQVEAVFLFNFIQFVEWPASTFPSGNSPFVIGILGKDPFGNYLTETIGNGAINGHPIILRHYTTVEEAKSCHIVFINLEKSAEVKHALISLKKQSILTVSDKENFTQLGGIIQFVKRSNKIGLRINMEHTSDANLTISSKLLRLAEIVK